MTELKIQKKLNKTGTLTSSITVLDDFITTKKGYIYLITKKNNQLEYFDIDLFIFNKTHENSFLLQYFRENDPIFYDKIKIV